LHKLRVEDLIAWKNVFWNSFV